MIVSFSVSNYRSFASEETFSLVASKSLAGRHEEHTVPIPDSDERVLRTAVIYGANAAGKSNLFKALRYLRIVALQSRRKGAVTGRVAFGFGGMEKEPSCFDLQFIARNRLYRFGFKIDDQRVQEEWLVRVIGGREKALYERITDDQGQVKIDASGLRNAGDKVLALATVGGPPNQSFLATLLATVDPSDFGEELRGIESWLRSSLNLIPPSGSIRPLQHALARNPDLLRFAGEFLKSASTGVDRLQVARQEISEAEAVDGFHFSVLQRLSNGDSFTVTLRDGDELLVEGNNGNRYYRVRVEAAHLDHTGELVPLELKDESDGTRRLLDLIPALHQMKKRSAVFVIDEIERSLHPMLVRIFLESFLKVCEGEQRQIIVTTHESSLLDQDLLRRDEIWFAEKDGSSATRIYSLTDFKVRNDLEIRKHYLQGRFGAVPFFGGMERLLEQHDGNA